VFKQPLEWAKNNKSHSATWSLSDPPLGLGNADPPHPLRNLEIKGAQSLESD